MKPVFAANILPNFLDLVLHPNLPLFMPLPYSPQHSLQIHPTEHLTISTSVSTTVFTNGINLLNKKHASNSNPGIEISFSGASLHLLVHNLLHSMHYCILANNTNKNTCTITLPRAITKPVYLYSAFFTT